MTGGHATGWVTTLFPPVGYLLSPVFGFSLASYGPALVVTCGSIAGILLKFWLDELVRRKTREEWRTLAEKPKEEWDASLEEKPKEQWGTAEYRIAALKEIAEKKK